MQTGKRIRKFSVTTLTAALLTIQLFLAPVTVLRVQAAPITMSDGTVFDPAYYAETYPDVRAAFGNDTAKLWQHYTMFGIREGRSPVAPGTSALTAASATATFDPVFYANRYPDLKAAFGNDAAKLWQHYLAYGEKEKRQAAANHVPGTKINAPSGTAQLPVTVPAAATAAASQTPAAAPATAPASVSFDPVFYANRYPDLRAVFGNDAAKLWQHYLAFGEKEGRQAAANHVPGSKVTAPQGSAAQAAVPAAPVFQAGGKRVAFIGDSITTFDGHIPPTYATYYPKGDVDQVQETWWYQVSARAGFQVVMNASWSGSCVTGARGDTSGTVGSGQGRIRTVVAQQPNIVFIAMGVNDFFWDIKPEEFRECYYALASQLRSALPNSLIICCTCFPQFYTWRNALGHDLEVYNSIIRQVAGQTGCYLIDTGACGLTRAHMVDNDLHPNVAGATVVANYILARLPQMK